MTQASNLESQGRRESDPLKYVASFLNGHPKRLKVHVWRSVITCMASLVGTVGTMLFIVWGPNLDEPAAIFASFLLLTFVSLFSVGILSIVTPIMSLFACQRLAQGQVDLNNLDLQEELESARGQLIKSARIFRELGSAREAELERVLKQHEEEIAELSQWT